LTSNMIIAATCNIRIKMGSEFDGIYNGIAMRSIIYYSILVVVDTLTGSAHFITIKSTY